MARSIALLAFVAGCSTSQPVVQAPDVSAGLSSQYAERIDAVMEPWDNDDTPGCAVALTRGGELGFAKGYGMADMEQGVPITPTTVFDIGSTSKQFTATAVLLAEAEGTLALDDDIRAHVPMLPQLSAQPTTLEHLLHHTGGLRDYVDYDRLPIGASWSFDPPGLIPNVTITILDAEHQGIFPWTSDPEFPGDTCKSSWDNNTTGLLEIDPTDPVFRLKYGTAEVRGGHLIDRATLESTRTLCGDHCSGLSISADSSAGTAELNWMLALGEQDQVVDGIQIDRFRAELQGPIPAVSDGRGGYEIAAGAALFALSGSAMGADAIVYASNLRPLYFRPGRTGGWDVDPIQVEYQNPTTAEVFEFFIGATTWD